MRALILTAALAVAAAADAQPPPPAGQSQPVYPAPWGKVRVGDGVPVTARPAPPREGRKRCIGVGGIAGAQMFGDRGIELTMKGGARYRMFFARDCPALSFYQGFYYRRAQAGQLCAGRDAVGARSGGECDIASILPVRKFSR